MYQYEFVKIGLKSGFVRVKPKEDYKEIINTYAKKGWRLVQVFAPAISGYGSSSYFELIFEKKLSND